MRARIAGVVTATLLALTACGSGEPSPGGETRTAARSTPSEATSSSFLDGTWEASISRRAFLRYMQDHGVRRADAVAAAEVDHMGTDFSVKFVEGMFNVTGPTGDSWHSGDFEVRGDELLLTDEETRAAGHPPFRLVITRRGDQVQFEVAPGQEAGPDHRPGVPGLVAGGALWCPAPWRRVA